MAVFKMHIIGLGGYQKIRPSVYAIGFLKMYRKLTKYEREPTKFIQNKVTEVYQKYIKKYIKMYVRYQNSNIMNCQSELNTGF